MDDNQPDNQEGLNQDSVNQSQTDLRQPISWQAPEPAHEPHNAVWYLFFAVVVIGLMALSIFVFKSITFTILIPVMTVAVILLSFRPPQIIQYSIGPKGIYVGDKLYDFSEFRAFGVVQSPRGPYIIVLPVKRFSPGVTLYFDQFQGEAIVDMLGARLPIQEIKEDSMEKFIRLIRL